MKIIIAGGRSYKSSYENYYKIKKILTEEKCTEIVSGGCVGADLYGEILAKRFGIPVKKIIAHWKKYGKSAGPMRNEKMAKYADGCILLPGGTGTANMKMNAEKYGLKIWEIK